MATEISRHNREKLHVEFQNGAPESLDNKHIANNRSKPPSVRTNTKSTKKKYDRCERKSSICKTRKNSIFSLSKGDSQSLGNRSGFGSMESVSSGRTDDLYSARFSQGRSSALSNRSRKISVEHSKPMTSRSGRSRMTSGSEDDTRFARRRSDSSAFGLTSMGSSPRNSIAGPDSVFESVVASGRGAKRWSSRIKQAHGDKGRRASTKVDEDEPEPKFPAIQTFRRIARLVRLLCSVCIALRSYAIGKGLLDNYLVSISHRANIGKSDNDADDLSFNLENFKIKKELEVPESTKLVLNKLPDDRTPSDIEAILRLMRELPSFRKYTREMQQLFCRIVRYMRCNQNRVVLRKGHIGYNLYFIFTGTCSVVLDKDEKSLFVKKEVIVLRKGACFGEIALVQNTRRNATVVCTQDTEFLVVDKDLFLEKGLNHQMEEEFRTRFNVFRGLKIISHWDDAKVRELSNVSRNEEFGYNRIIVKDSKVNDWLWFVVKGSCDIVRLVDLETCDSYKRLINDPSPESRASLETLVAATRGAVVQLDAGSCKSGSAWSLSSNIKIPTSKDKVKKAPQKEKPIPQAELTEGISEVDIGRIDDMLHNLRNNQVSEVLLSLKEKAQESMDREIQKEKEEQILESLKDPGIGLFFKVDTLRDSQCFDLGSIVAKKKAMIKGLESLDDEYVSKRTFTLVSRGCEVIHVPKTRFTEISDKETIAAITKDCKIYPSDDELCHRFIERCNWDAYKREVVEEVIIRKERSRGFDAGLRTGKLKGQDIAKARKTGEKKELLIQVATTSPPPPGPHSQPNVAAQRPHTAFARRLKDSESKNTNMKSSWDSDLDKAKKLTETRSHRPSTCPPRVSKLKMLSRARMGASTDRLPATGEGSSASLPHKTSNLSSSKGYHVDGTNIYVRGSQRTLQIISGVRSPSHEYRLNKLGTK